MARRSDHSRDELRAIIIAEGHRHMQEVGFAAFSARKVAQRIGYSIGTLYNVFSSYDGLISAINGRTLDLWHDYLAMRMASVSEHRLSAAIHAYFEFALLNRHSWAALYDFRLPEDTPPDGEYQDKVRAIMTTVETEIAAALPAHRRHESAPLARSLLATVHGHCVFTMNGTFRILGEADPVAAALARVEQAIG
jgi:AcrR family transcriptional regulator